jgi:alpha-beta hydrolase superfamily lysophospholipase/uncharacterized membrane protein HdeD (DUF308 family)
MAQDSAGWRLVTGAVGVAAVVLGAALVARPFASLAVLELLVVLGLLSLGLGLLLGAPRPWPRSLRLMALAWFAAGLALLLWPGPGLRVLVLLVGLGLVVEGVTRLVGGLGAGVTGRRTPFDARLSAALLGVSAVALGVLALVWPDVTVLALAILFGFRVLWFGLGLVWRSVRGRRGPAPADRDGPATSPAIGPAGPVSGARPPGRLRRAGDLVVGATAVLLTVALVTVSNTLGAGTPAPDAFYAAPAGAPPEPGVLLRSEPFDRGMPEGSRAWRLLYTTGGVENEPAVASALVIAGPDRPGPRPVVAWAHGTTGYAEACAPTLLEDPLGSGAMPALDRVLEEGWVVVATDYVGLGTEGPHPYLIGEPGGRNVLDAVRAARALEDLRLSDQTVVWGHSQGGGVALWTGILAPAYAPDVPLSGVAALAPASDLSALLPNLDEVPGGALFASYVIAAYSETYDDVDFDEYVRPAARIPLQEMAERCLAEPGVLVSILESLAFDGSVWGRDPASGPLGERLAQNVPAGPIEAPLLVAQGETDELVLPEAQAAYVAGRCAQAGGPVEFRTYPDRDHVGVVADDSELVPELMEWTRARFAGDPAASTC